MDPVFLARLQFGLTIGFHYIFPPLSIGLGLHLVIMEGLFLKTKDPVYEVMTKFWVKIFGLIFAIGVATGIVMEFQFGTNWATYSRFVGDVFGSALAAEGIFAFFLESGFLAILLFGWNKVGPKMHFFATCMVALGAMFSAIWIIVANSWMQTPAGHHIVGTGLTQRAEITDFWALVFNPSTVDRLVHVLLGAYQAGAWVVISVSAFYLIKKIHLEFAKRSIKIALIIALLAGAGQIVSGHSSAVIVAEHQPTKLAAMEGHFEENAPAGMRLFGWVDDEAGVVRGDVTIPGLLSFLATWDFNAPLKGLSAFPRDEWPPVNITFQTFHAMVAIGTMLLFLSLLGIMLLKKERLFEMPWLLWIFVFAVILPQIANQVGWIVAEVGRQPWIVYGILKTADATSSIVSSGQILGSLVMFSFVYGLLFCLFVFLLNHKIKVGPVLEKLDEETVEGHHV